jgi:lysophospholipase L1-like esterase
MKIKIILLFFITTLLVSFSRKDITWIAIGDSITYINNDLKETGFRLNKGYMTQVVEKLPSIHYVNKGFNGWTSGGIAQAFDSLGITTADVYSVFLGTNDWFSGRPLGTFENYLKQSGNSTVYGSFRIILDKLRAINGKAKIILITPMQRTDFVYLFNMKNNAIGSDKKRNNQSLDQFAEAIITIGRYEHLPVVDLYDNKKLSIDKLVRFKRLKDPQTGLYKNYLFPGYETVPFNPETDEYPYPPEAIGMTYDGLHPSDMGCAEIAGMLEEVMKNY